MYQSNEIKTSDFHQMMEAAGIGCYESTIRHFLQQYPELGKIENKGGPGSRKYIYHKDKAEEFIKFRNNTHEKWYSLINLCRETNSTKLPYEKWRRKFQYNLVYKLGIVPVKIYGFAYVPREKVKWIKQKLNPIRSNIK